MSGAPFSNRPNIQGAGQNYGTVNINVNTMAERALLRIVEKPPAEVYVPRRKVLDLLAAKFEPDTGVAVTSVQAVSEGGYGKTWLARAYAHEFQARYPGGMFEIRAGNNRSLMDHLADLYGPDEDLKVNERAEAAFLYLSGEKRCLLILDNVENREQWETFGASGLLPTAHCHILVTTRSFDLPHLPQVDVGRLEDDEAAELLAKYFPTSVQRPDLVKQIIKESEGMAVLIAAVGASLKNGSLAEMVKYVDWLVRLVPNRNGGGVANVLRISVHSIHDWMALPLAEPFAGGNRVTYLRRAGLSMVRWLARHIPEPDADGDWAQYPQKSGAIFQSLYRRIEPAAVRALEYAALFPPDQINPEDLEAVVLADQTRRKLAWRVQLTGRPVSVETYLAPLRTREILTGLDAGPWSLHRLHRRALIARLSDRELAARVARLSARASERFQIANDEHDQSLYLSAIKNISYSIALRQGIRDALAPRGEWAPALQNDLAGAHVNRGNAYQKAQDLAAAIEEYGVAITIRTGIRKALEPRGEWAPALQNNLAAAHVNRGVAYQNAQDLAAAIEDLGVAITIMTGIRDALAPRGEWAPALQNDLASAHVNRGNAYQKAQDLAAAIEDYGVAITIMTGIREALAPRGEWAPALQNDLASAHMNRGEALRNAHDLAAAIGDCGVAITIMTGIREALAPRGEWTPEFQNDLAGAHMNRGIAYADAQDLAATIGDYGVALPILSQLAESFAEFAVDVHRLLANWSLLGVGLTPDYIRLALANLQRLQTRFEAPTLARLQIPKFNRQIADGLPKVTPRLSPAELTAARTALLGSA